MKKKHWTKYPNKTVTKKLGPFKLSYVSAMIKCNTCSVIISPPFSLRHLVPGVVQSCDGEVKEGTNYCPQRVETVQLS